MSDEYPASGKLWSARETELLKELWAKATLDELGKVFKRKANAVRQKGNELGLPGKGKGVADMINEDALEELQRRIKA